MQKCAIFTLKSAWQLFLRFIFNYICTKPKNKVMISTHFAAFILGAVTFALILKNNPKLQAYFNRKTDEIEVIIEEKLDKDI